MKAGNVPLSHEGKFGFHPVIRSKHVALFGRLALSLLGALALCVIAAFPASAQALPGPVQPGRIQQQLQPPPSAPAVTPSGRVHIQSAPRKPIIGGTFLLRKVVVVGSTIYRPDAFTQSFAPYIGKSIGDQGIGQIEQIVTVKYRQDGYILSHGITKSVDPRTGVITVEAVEGYIEKVQLDPLAYEVGGKGGLLKIILNKIVRACHGADRLTDGKPCPLNRDELERYLLLANDLPGVRATAVVQASPNHTGAADLFVTINEKPVDLNVTLDNRGSVYVGPMRLQGTAAYNNLLGFYDRTELRAGTAGQPLPFNDLYLVGASEQIPLTSDGLRLAFDYTYAQARPGDLLKQLNLTDITNSGDIILSYPWLRTRSQNLMLHSDLNIQNNVTLERAQTLFDDKTRAIELGATYDLADQWLGVNLVDFRFTQGIPAFGATPADSGVSSHAGAPPDFRKLNIEVSRLQQIVPQWNLLGGVKAQYGFTRLLAGEQFGFGGEQYGRAYDDSEMLGDSGVAGKLELQYTPTWGPGLFGWSQGVKALQFYVFADGGRVWTDNSPGGRPPAHETGSSAGGGARFSLGNIFSGYLEVAAPLTSPVEAEFAKNKNDGWGPRVFFAISARY